MRMSKPPKAERHEFMDAGFFVMRTPLLPVESFTSWKVDEDDTSDSLISGGRKALLDSLADPRVEEALFIASPSLHDRLAYWRANPHDERGQKIQHALVRYFTRMCTRATPFGLFAGISVGRIKEKNQLILGSGGDYRRHARIDTGFVCALAELLLHDSIVKGAVRFFPNDSIYVHRNKIRFIEYHTRGGSRKFKLSEAEQNLYLDFVLKNAGQGIALKPLSEKLAEYAEVELGEATEYLDELILCKILISELEPTLTAEEPFHSLASLVKRIVDNLALPDQGGLPHRILELETKIEELNLKKIGIKPAAYLDISSIFADFDLPRNISHTFQVDMFKPAEDLQLGAGIVNEIAACAGDLYAINSAGAPELEDFARKFRERYEMRKVPLVDVLDEEHGIGFGRRGYDEAPLLKGINLDGSRERPGSGIGAFDTFLVHRVLSALKDNATEIELTRADLSRFMTSDTRIAPRSFCANAMLFADAPDKDISKVFVKFSSSSASSMLGRFCYGEPELRRCVTEMVRLEEQADADVVIAEIVHLPRGRTGNVIARPAFSEYELVYLGRSGLPETKQIAVSDLMLSYVNGGLQLWSCRLGKRVIPRLSSAHNYLHADNLSLYRFLAIFQYANAGRVGFSWPEVLQMSRFLPRVKYGNIYLSRAKWNLSPHDMKELRSAKVETQLAAAQRLRALHSLPRFVALVEGDNILPVDFTNPLSVANFAAMLDENAYATLEESFSDQLYSPVSGPEGRYAAEFLIPFMSKQGNKAEYSGVAKSASAASASQLISERNFYPGQQWLYIKLYCGSATADALIRNVVGPLAEQLLRDGVISSWFFIRYSDPERHLRIRFSGPPDALWSIALKKIHAAVESYLVSGSVWTMKLDTYERETERYGGANAIGFYEKIFYADSRAVAELLSLLQHESEASRTECAFMGVNWLLSDFGLSLGQRRTLMRTLTQQFSAEFSVKNAQEVAMGKQYRAWAERLWTLLTDGESRTDLDQAALRIFQRRSSMIKPLIAELNQTIDEAFVMESARSVIHMFINRLIRSAQREHELVLYDFLRRHYESRVHRSAKSPAPPLPQLVSPI